MFFLKQETTIHNRESCAIVQSKTLKLILKDYLISYCFLTESYKLFLVYKI